MNISKPKGSKTKGVGRYGFFGKEIKTNLNKNRLE